MIRNFSELDSLNSKSEIKIDREACERFISFIEANNIYVLPSRMSHGMQSEETLKSSFLKLFDSLSNLNLDG